MDWLRLLGLCILVSAMVLLLRQMHRQTAALLSVAFGAMVLLCVLPGAAQYMTAILSFLDGASLGAQYGKTLLKATGIVLVTQLTSEVCQEMDAPGIARRAELCGRLALMGVAVPVFMSLTQAALEMLG